MREEKDKRTIPEPTRWVHTGRNVQDSEATSRTKVNTDTDGWDKPVDYNFNAPVREESKFDLSKGFWNAIQPQKPAFDEERAERLKRLARVNAFGDFMKHLGAFAGSGYAPTEKRQENKNVLRAFAELDKMRELYDNRMDKYNSLKFNTDLQDLAYQRNRADQDYERKYRSEENAAMRDWQTRENIRKNKEQAYYTNNTKKINTQHGEVNQFKNADLLNAELEAKRSKGGSGKGPFARVQFKNSKDIITAEEWQARQALAELKNIYADVITKAATGSHQLTDAEQRIVNDIGMLDAAMEKGNNSSAVKDLFARYLENNWPKLQYIWKNVNPQPQVTVSDSGATDEAKPGETGTALPGHK